MAARYEHLFKTLNGPGDARPTARQIIEDEQLKDAWPNKTIMITGVSSGIGIETAKALYETGATLYLTARDLKKAESALSDIIESERVHLLKLDLNSLISVRKCADVFLAQSDRLNVLINNAGIMACPEGRTKDGFELQLGTNHLAHFLLIQLLLPTLQKSTEPGFNSRVVCLSSVAHRDGSVNFENLTFEGEYHAWAAYAQSKTANLWCANELNRQFGPKGVHAWAVHPGGITTGLGKHLSDELVESMKANKEVKGLMKSPQQGAATTVWAATAQALEGQGGKYLEDCQIAKPYNSAASSQYGPGYAPHAYSPESEHKLWEKSLELVQSFLH